MLMRLACPAKAMETYLLGLDVGPARQRASLLPRWRGLLRAERHEAEVTPAFRITLAAAGNSDYGPGETAHGPSRTSLLSRGMGNAQLNRVLVDFAKTNSLLII